MTLEESLKLKRGDVLETKAGSCWIRVRYIHHMFVNYNGAPAPSLMVRVCRPENYSPNGRCLRRMKRHVNALVAVGGGIEPVAANVYADWLEQHGELRAANKLREAFPIHAEVIA